MEVSCWGVKWRSGEVEASIEGVKCKRRIEYSQVDVPSKSVVLKWWRRKLESFSGGGSGNIVKWLCRQVMRTSSGGSGGSDVKC